MKMLLPSDEMHFLRWFWNNVESYIDDRNGGEIDQLAAIIDYEADFDRSAPYDYKVRVANS